jgi:hypothetical protein
MIETDPRVKFEQLSLCCFSCPPLKLGLLVACCLICLNWASWLSAALSHWLSGISGFNYVTHFGPTEKVNRYLPKRRVKNWGPDFIYMYI